MVPGLLDVRFYVIYVKHGDIEYLAEKYFNSKQELEAWPEKLVCMTKIVVIKNASSSTINGSIVNVLTRRFFN